LVEFLFLLLRIRLTEISCKHFSLFLLSVLPSSLLGKRPLAGKRFVVKITDFSNNKVDDWIFYFPTAESSFIILAVVNCNNNVWTGFCGVC
jgi:hypothetical protein